MRKIAPQSLNLGHSIQSYDPTQVARILLFQVFRPWYAQQRQQHIGNQSCSQAVERRSERDAEPSLYNRRETFRAHREPAAGT
jgi:hypothetical protein